MFLDYDPQDFTGSVTRKPKGVLTLNLEAMKVSEILVVDLSVIKLSTLGNSAYRTNINLGVKLKVNVNSDKTKARITRVS